jgi:hypothetical protein
MSLTDESFVQRFAASSRAEMPGDPPDRRGTPGS